MNDALKHLSKSELLTYVQRLANDKRRSEKQFPSKLANKALAIHVQSAC
jgi:hypothetical protein